MRRLRFNGTGSGGDGCPSVHEDLDTGEIIVHGPPLTERDDITQLQHLSEGETAIVLPRTLLVDFGPKEATRVPRIIDLVEFGRLFTTFKHTAWRLETRRRYASDEDTETYAQFTRGEPVVWDGVDSEWCVKRREQSALGKRFERVRIVDNPPTDGQLCSTTRSGTAPWAKTFATSRVPTPSNSSCRKKTSGSSTPGSSPCSTSTTRTT